MAVGHNDDLVGMTLSHYRLCAPLGSGGMGTVYRARDERLGRDVAVKVLIDNVTTEDGRRSLIDEARILSRLTHPNIAAVYDVDRARGRDFLVLEFVPGITLDELLTGGALQPTEVVRLGVQMARGLAAAHEAGIIHRDVKPANIKMTPSGELKLLDFGVAVLLSDPRTPAPTARTAGPLGTVPFMSPEQFRGDPVDARSDIFSAGAVLYQMATGRAAFPQRQLACLIDAVLNLEPVAPRVISSTVPVGLERVVLKALRKAPPDRYQTAMDLAYALETALRDAPGVTRWVTMSVRRLWKHATSTSRGRRVHPSTEYLQT